MAMTKPRKVEQLSVIPVVTSEQPPTSTSAILLTPEQLAQRLAVRPSWIREKTRERARVRDKDPLPVVRLGKYTRFRWSDIEAWLARQDRGA
jgi:predicted DNA-binding transcriptional regulator AlpA